ncbi:unnamed protein product [Protopolystoma xenopodis]|uniref:Uncharacterized protein n=1 Tax=Protopolystoma xenopodis TaxID=117903 RepID=A0A3S5CIY8_9PLAT|nr:unnamed protein product [Protopolystoma xenopodis]
MNTCLICGSSDVHFYPSRVMLWHTRVADNFVLGHYSLVSLSLSLSLFLGEPFELDPFSDLIPSDLSIWFSDGAISPDGDRLLDKSVIYSAFYLDRISYSPNNRSDRSQLAPFNVIPSTHYSLLSTERLDTFFTASFIVNLLSAIHFVFHSSLNMLVHFCSCRCEPVSRLVHVPFACCLANACSAGNPPSRVAVALRRLVAHPVASLQSPVAGCQLPVANCQSTGSVNDGAT